MAKVRFGEDVAAIGGGMSLDISLTFAATRYLDTRLGIPITTIRLHDAAHDSSLARRLLAYCTTSTVPSSAMMPASVVSAGCLRPTSARNARSASA